MPLNNPIINAKTAIARYIFAGVQSFSKLTFIFILYYYYFFYFLKVKNIGFLNLFNLGLRLNVNNVFFIELLVFLNFLVLYLSPPVLELVIVKVLRSFFLFKIFN